MRHWRKRWVIFLAGLIVLVNMLALAVGIYLQHAATRSPWSRDARKSYAQIFGVSDDELTRWFKSERFARLTKEPVPITFRRGETINGLLVYGHGSSRARGTVVLEGYPYTVMPVGDVFLDRSFNVFIYRQPFASGKIGFGYFEKYDLEAVVRAVRQKDPQGAIGVFGASRVGATALQLAAMREGSGDVAFYIIDAAFSDLRDLLRFHYRRDVGVPLDPLVYGYASLVNYLRDGYFFRRRVTATVDRGRADPCAVHPWPGRPGDPLPNDGRTLPGQARREVAADARRRARAGPKQGRRSHRGKPRGFRAEGG